MKAIFGLAVAAATLTVGAPAMAATMVTTDGTPLTYMIHDMTTSSSKEVVLDTKPTDYLVNYTSDSTLDYVGGGFAQVTGVGGAGSKGVGFSDLTIAPESPLKGFSEIKFNLDNMDADVNTPSGYKFADLTFVTVVDFVGGGSQSFTTDVGNGNGDNRYLVTAAPGQEIASITFEDLDAVFTKSGKSITEDENFNSIKQVSFNAAAVPEPATWGMMILGLAGTGALLRRRRQGAQVA